MDGHDGSAAQKAAKVYPLAYLFAGGGNEADSGGLVIYNADCGFIRNDGGDGVSTGITGDGDHVKAHGAHAGHGLKLINP